MCFPLAFEVACNFVGASFIFSRVSFWNVAICAGGMPNGSV